MVWVLCVCCILLSIAKHTHSGVLFIKAASVTCARAFYRTKTVRERKTNTRHHQKTPRAIDFRYTVSLLAETSQAQRNSSTINHHQWTALDGVSTELSNEPNLNNAPFKIPCISSLFINLSNRCKSKPKKDPWAHLLFTHTIELAVDPIHIYFVLCHFSPCQHNHITARRSFFFRPDIWNNFQFSIQIVKYWINRCNVAMAIKPFEASHCCLTTAQALTLCIFLVFFSFFHGNKYYTALFSGLVSVRQYLF